MTQSSGSVSPRLQRARELFRDRVWAEAHMAFLELDAEAPLELDDLWSMSMSATLCGRDAAGLAALERIHESALERLPAKAARAAFWLGFRLMHMGEVSRANGWLARAEKALEKLGAPCVERGYLELPRVRQLFYSGDYEGALAAASRAVDVAEAFADADLASFALNLKGRSKIRLGEVEAGLLLHDEAMLAATKGELSATVTGLIYCAAIDSCHSVYDIERMREWTSSLKGWCDAQPQLCPFTGECMVHRAEIMELSGEWPQALAEARRATERIRETYGARATGAALFRQGEIHRVRGELEQAEERYREASQVGYDPQPGLSLLRLAQCKAEAAAQGLRRALASVGEPLGRVALLAGQVEVALATKAFDEAQAAAAELEAIAQRFASRMLCAQALDACGRVELARGEAQAALGKLRRAFEIWQQLAAPYHAARTRVQLACACQALGDEDGAFLGIQAARAVFEQLGAALDIAQIDAVLGQADKPAHTSGLTTRELEVLRLVASGKTNKLIATELCLSEKTVDRHVSNILAKLAVPSRAAATAFAYENKLI